MGFSGEASFGGCAGGCAWLGVSRRCSHANHRALCRRVPTQAELDHVLKDYVGRETPLYHAERLSARYAK